MRARRRIALTATALLVLVGLTSSATAVEAGRKADDGAARKLTASDSMDNDSFGVSVGISGNTAVIGANGNSANGFFAGAAYIFQRSGREWREVTRLVASGNAGRDRFGFAVDISGNTAVVGALGHSALGIDAGAVYVFKRNQGGRNNWGQVAKLTAADGTAGANFGASVAIHRNTIVVGAPEESEAAEGAGAAYIFKRNQGGRNNWGQVAKLTAADAGIAYNFGVVVDVHRDTVVVGDPLAAGAGPQTGSAYVFRRNEGGRDSWGQVAQLEASDASANDFFGTSVAVHNRTIVVGAFGDDDSGEDAGAAYVFRRARRSWQEEAKLTAKQAAASRRFGVNLDIDRSTIWISAAGTAPGSTPGAVHVFRRARHRPRAWTEVSVFSSPDADDRADLFGRSVAINGKIGIVGATLARNDDGVETGAAYVFRWRDLPHHHKTATSVP